MNLADVFSDLASRPVQAAAALPQLDSQQLNAHVAGHPNSIAWLLWHSGREVDAQVSQLSGQTQVWPQFRERFALGHVGESVGYGQSSKEAATVIVEDQALLVDYLHAALAALTDYTSTLTPAAFSEVIDEHWDPPVTRGARLISIVDDAIAHTAQAAFAAGTLTR